MAFIAEEIVTELQLHRALRGRVSKWMRWKRVNVKLLMQLIGKSNATEVCLHELQFSQDAIYPWLHKDTYKNTYAMSSVSLLLFTVNPIGSHIQ